VAACGNRSWYGTPEVLQSQKNVYTLLIPVDENYVKISFFGTLEFGRVGIPEL